MCSIRSRAAPLPGNPLRPRSRCVAPQPGYGRSTSAGKHGVALTGGASALRAAVHAVHLAHSLQQSVPFSVFRLGRDHQRLAHQTHEQFQHILHQHDVADTHGLSGFQGPIPGEHR